MGIADFVLITFAENLLSKGFTNIVNEATNNNVRMYVVVPFINKATKEIKFMGPIQVNTARSAGINFHDELMPLTFNLLTTSVKLNYDQIQNGPWKTTNEDQ